MSTAIETVTIKRMVPDDIDGVITIEEQAYGAHHWSKDSFFNEISNNLAYYYTAKDEQNKTNLVKKALAGQRAKFGASGVNATSTTAGAVLRRLRDENSQSFDDKKANNLIKLKNIKTTKPNLLKKLLSRTDDIVG